VHLKTGSAILEYGLIQGFVGELRKKGLSETTTRRIFNVVKASLNGVVKMELIKKNPASIIEKPKVIV
jgi:site-specific recombinase XerC